MRGRSEGFRHTRGWGRPRKVHILCREYTLVKDFDAGFYATPLCCRSWTCDYCRAERKARVAYEAGLGYPDTFITLTTNPARAGTPATRAAELVAAWRGYIKWAKKHYGYLSIPYFAVFEATKLGQPHLHILCRVKWLDQRELSNWMKNAIDAPIVDIRRTSSTRAAAKYISKYMGKAPGKFGTCKRYWQTKDYRDPKRAKVRPEDKQPGIWRIVRQRLDDLLLHHTISGTPIKKDGPIWTINARSPP